MSSENSDLQDLFHRVEAGDSEAIAEFVQKYQRPLVTIIARRLEMVGIDHLEEPGDVLQSVWAAFFEGLGDGRFEIRSAGELYWLLHGLAVARVLKHRERYRAARRDCRRTTDLPPAEIPDTAPEPQSLDDSDRRKLIKRAESVLSDEERYLLHQRAEGRRWSDLARELCASVSTLRMRFFRTCQRAREAITGSPDRPPPPENDKLMGSEDTVRASALAPFC